MSNSAAAGQPQAVDTARDPHVIMVVMGVSGSGKTTVGQALADRLGGRLLDAETLHSDANIAKMSSGIPLTDADRAGWLSAVHAQMAAAVSARRPLVVACSALKQSYRDVLAEGLAVTWIYLRAPADLIRWRLQHRTGHFMKADMLASQFAVLEEPSSAIVVDASQPPEAVVRDILAVLPDCERSLSGQAMSVDAEPGLQVCTDVAELSHRLATAMVATIDRVVQRTGRCSLVLSGGTTPRALYGVLASARFRDRIPWPVVHVFWGDERYVPPDDPRSNYGMARAALLDHVPCPPANVHPMPTQFAAAEDAARDYEQTLRRWFDGERPRFDLVLLGLGDDGHTASLFPGAPALAERTRWVVAVQAPAEPPLRLTLTLPVLTGAGAVHFMVAGSSKRAALRHVLAGPHDWTAYPAAGVHVESGELYWWVDREAAGGEMGSG